MDSHKCHSAAVTHPGAGPAASNETPPVGQPAGKEDSAYPAGGRTGLRIAAECDEYDGLRHSVLGSGSSRAERLSPGQLGLGRWNALVQLDLWAISGRFGRDGAGPGTGNWCCDAVPFPVQRQLCIYAAESLPAVCGHGRVLCHVGGGRRVLLPTHLGLCGVLRVKRCGGGLHRSATDCGRGAGGMELFQAEKTGVLNKYRMWTL